MSEMKKYLGANSDIAKKIVNYEYRPQQVAMADAVRHAILTKKHLLVEAGCGVGKSFSYLIPFILWAAKKKENRVAISTYTITLQQQLIEKDIPFLKKSLNMNFNAVLCVGSENYLCLNRMNSILQNRLLDTPEEAHQLQEIFKWSSSTKDGLKLNIDFNVSSSLWSDVCRNSDICFEKKCSYFNTCFYFHSRKQQSKADILILNHHLLFSDAASTWNLFPKYEAIVFDEAHNIENIASDILGSKVSMFGVKYLLSRIHKAKSSRYLLKKYKQIPTKIRKNIIDAVTQARKQTDIFFEQVLDEFPSQNITHRLTSTGSGHSASKIFDNCLSDSLLQLSSVLSFSVGKVNNIDTKTELLSYSKRCKIIANELKSILSRKSENYVYYIDIKTKRRRVYCSFNATPINISELMEKFIFNHKKPVIMTSATLTINNSFDFIKKRLGISSTLEIQLDSPFNYKTNVLLYAPGDLPDPAYAYDKFQKELSDRISEILEITKGRTFILFTSFASLNNVAENLTDRFNNINFLIHGELPRKQLLKDFAENQNSVLLGTATFWQGVDFPGRALECVILTRLPFAVPSDPIVEARINEVKRKGLNAFINYQVPVAALFFKQGFGRLIRHRNDFGIVAILDPRVKTRKYGSIFIDTLPQCREVKDIEELSQKYKLLKEKSF